MSQRALKKRDQSWQKCEKEIHQPMYRKQAQPLFTHRSKYIQRPNGNGKHTTNRTCAENKSNRDCIIKQKCSSTPNLTTIDEDENDFGNRSELQRSHSESDLSRIPESNVLAHAKSEFHLTSIASTQVASESVIPIPSRQPKTPAKARNKHFSIAKQSNHRSTIQVQLTGEMNTDDAIASNTFHFPRSLLTTAAAQASASSSKADCTDSPNIRIPIVGFEVMEERARFTVYKLRIEKSLTNDSWIVLRRYTDFVRLNNKLKSQFPHFPPLILPRKKLFGDNFSSIFLTNRVHGLQSFINTVLEKRTLRNSQPVRDFFCLDEPPAYPENTEECRAIFEAQEDTINQLKLQLRAKDEAISTLQQQLHGEIEKNYALSTAIKFSYDNCADCSARFDVLMKCQAEIINKK